MDLEYWLVNHPTIQNFSWTPGKTLGSSTEFLIFTILTYLSFIFILSHPYLLSFSNQSQPSITPSSLSSPSSWPLVAFSPPSLMHLISTGSSVSLPTPHPLDHSSSGLTSATSPRSCSSDTLLIILSNSTQRLSFLHVCHHSTVVVMCYIWLQTSQSLFPAVLVTNASVHVLMYAYYLSCALGVRPKWKKLVTDCQILQFYSSFVVLGLMLHYHFTGSDCSGVWGWIFNVVFYASLLALFVDFHRKNYGSSKKRDSTTLSRRKE